MKTDTYFYARGRRKTAHAHIKLLPGNGIFTINQKRLDTPDELMREPLKLVSQESKWNVEGFVRGGGSESQKEAIRLAVARALVESSSDLKTTLRKAGFLTRDPREKERKKPGLKRARRAPQWSKR